MKFHNYLSTIRFSGIGSNINLRNTEDYPDEALCPKCSNFSGLNFYLVIGVDTFKEECDLCLGTGLDPVPSFEVENNNADV